YIPYRRSRSHAGRPLAPGREPGGRRVRPVVVDGDEAMMDRLLLALGTALLCVGPTFAEAPSAPPPSPPAAAPDDKPAAAPDDKPALRPQGWCPSGCGSAATDGQFWATGEYLLAWFSGDRLPALVTTSPAGTARASAGIPGLATTTTLFGDEI